MQTKLLPYYEYLAPAKVKCKTCGAELDTRGGRAITHLKAHGISLDGEAPAPTSTVQEKREEPILARGSREWAVQMVLSVADDPSSTSEQRLKALDLLKEYQDFGTKRLDDEKEAEASRLQWDRVFAKAVELRKVEDDLLKEPAVRLRLKAALERVR